MVPTAWATPRKEAAAAAMRSQSSRMISCSRAAILSRALSTTASLSLSSGVR